MSSNRKYQKIVGAYRPGSIIKLQLKNFLTYRKVEIMPGPRLNMVIGANGTGKSSILCALCLGLGGEPKLLGRADDARSFIMHEKEKATIVVTLAPHPDQEQHEIARVIERSKGSERGNGRGASTFFINNRKSSIKEIQQLVKETYKISVDNLCTFLPQDKVGSFSGFDQKQLLIESEKSIGGDALYNKHMKLIEYEKELNSGDSNVDSIKSKLAKLKTEQQRFEREKERMEEREQALESVGQYEKAINFKLLQNGLDEHAELKAEKKQLKADLKKAQQELQPLIDRANELEQRKEEVESTFKKQDKLCDRLKKDMDNLERKQETLEDKMESDLLDLKQVEDRRKAKVIKLNKAKEKLENAQASLSEFKGTKEEITKEYREATQEKKAAYHAGVQAKQVAGRLHHEFKEHEANAERASAKLARLQDEKTQRRRQVFSNNPNLAKIDKWLDQNRKNFRRRVWGPVAVECSMKTANAAAYLEQHVPNTVLFSFVVEDKADYDLMYNEVRKKLQCGVNIITVRNGELLPVQRPVGDEKMSILKREHGVIGYLDESFTAPDAVLQALRNMAQVHKVFVGGDETQKSIDKRGLLDFLAAPDRSIGQTAKQGSAIFASQGQSSKKYTQTVSRYNKEISSRDDDIRPARLLGKGVDPKVKADLENELSSIHEEMNKLRPKIEDAEEKKSQVIEAGQQAAERLKIAKEKLEEINKLQGRVATANERCQAAKNDLESDDDTSTKKKLLRAIMTGLASIVTTLEGHAAKHEKLLSTTFAMASVRIERDSVMQWARQARDDASNQELSFTDLQNRYTTISEKIKAKAAEVQEMHRNNFDEGDITKDDDGVCSPASQEVNELVENNALEELEAALEEAEQKVNAIHEDRGAIQRYHANLQEIEEVEAQLAKVEGDKDALGNKINQELQAWKANLVNATTAINERFVEYMGELGVTGEVRLKQGGESGKEDRDFKDWGIEIRVSFREGVKAQVLSAQVQSGGERSVSTILFLMAMQSLMRSPFRCVDEINQGMDERNERAIFKRIVQNSTAPPERGDPTYTEHCGQYFLITPKLLPSLLDMEQEAVTVLIVMNGPFNFERPTDFNVNKIVAAARSRRNKRPSIDAGEEDEENQENVLPSSRRASKKKRRSN